MKTFRSLFFYKRLFLANILVPLFLGFLLLTILGKSISKGMNEFDSTFSLGLVSPGGQNDLSERISKRRDIRFSEGITAANAQAKVSSGAIDLALILPGDFSEKIKNGKKTTIRLYHSNNQIQIEDLMSSVSRFEENIIIERMDSLNLSYDYIHPITIEDMDTSPSFIKKINGGISNYTPLLLLFFAFIGFIIPCNIIFSKTREKRQIRSNPLWDKIIGLSIWAVFPVIFLLLGLWLSFILVKGQPSFLKGIFQEYFSFGNCLRLIWILGISNLFWASVFAVPNHKAVRPIGAFGISYFLFTLIFSCIVFTSILFPGQGTEGLNLVLMIPPANVFHMIRDLFMLPSINWMNTLLYIPAGLVLGGIGFLSANKILGE